MEIESVYATLAGVAALLTFAVILFIWRNPRARLIGAGIGLTIALALLLLCVEQLLRLGWSYDLVARAPIRIHWPEAPIDALLGLIFLGLFAAIVIGVVLVVAFGWTIMAARFSRRGLLVMLLACVPTLVLYALQAQSPL
jgi:hypothetical protein